MTKPILNANPKTYGYARISTKNQSIDRQIRNILKAYPDTAKIYKEAFTGRKISRPKFDELKKIVKPGDTIVFDSVSRMSRSAVDGFELYQKLFDQGISLVFLKEPTINTDNYRTAMNMTFPELTQTEDEDVNEYLKELLHSTERLIRNLTKRQFFQAFEQAQKEVDDLSQRTKEGIETARRQGKQIGQVKGAVYKVKKADQKKAEILKYAKDFGGPLNDLETMKLIGLARNTYYKYKKELLIEDAEHVAKSDD